MRRIYSRYLKSVVGARLKAAVPEFLPVRVEAKRLLKHCSTVFASPCDGAVVYVILLLLPKNPYLREYIEHIRPQSAEDLP